MELGVDITLLTKKISQFRRNISKRNFLLEFGNSYLNYGEAQDLEKNILISKCNRTELDKKAIEKGSPADPKQMSEFLKQVINEDNIFAKRTAVVIPPEAAALLPLSKSSFSGFPGSRKCTWGSIAPGNRYNPVASITDSPF